MAYMDLNTQSKEINKTPFKLRDFSALRIMEQMFKKIVIQTTKMSKQVCKVCFKTHGKTCILMVLYSNLGSNWQEKSKKML